MTGTTDRPMSAAAAEKAWREHRFYKYAGCTPHPDNPRVLAARPDLPVDTHHPQDRDGQEPQADRVRREAAAVELCLNCPVMVQCDAYANSVTPEGRLAQPDGVWAGRLAKERRQMFAARRHEVARAAPDVQLQTDQKRDVLLALAMCADGDAGAVAAAAGVPVRTANWQRSRLVTQFNLEKASATRRELLAVAVRRGLLDASVVVADDGSVPAWSPATVHPPVAAAGREPRAGVSALPAPQQLPLWKPESTAEPMEAAA
jgi:hypothetical protein